MFVFSKILFKLVAFGQGGCIRAKVVVIKLVVFEQSGCIRAKWLYLGKSGCIPATMAVLG